MLVKLTVTSERCEVLVLYAAFESFKEPPPPFKLSNHLITMAGKVLRTFTDVKVTMYHSVEVHNML